MGNGYTMDFGTLLTVASKNERQSSRKPCYQTKFQPLKKESKQTKDLSDNIKKFLARKEEEERKKAQEEKQRKDVSWIFSYFQNSKSWFL